MTASIRTIDLRETAEHRNRNTKIAGEEMAIPRSETILLLPHCLRVSGTCMAKAEEDGLICVECNKNCQVNILRKAALEQGFKGVCIAPGGSLAIKYVKKTKPGSIIAVACPKELSEGIDNVKELFGEHAVNPPEITIIPLIKEGCIDTQVDIESALAKINEQNDCRYADFADEGTVCRTGSAW